MKHRDEKLYRLDIATIRLDCYRLLDIPCQIVTKLKSMGITGLLKHRESQYKWHLTMQKNLVSYMVATHSYIAS